MINRVVVLFMIFTFVKTVHAQTAVVELFTSQGCSSCPPADKLLREVQEHYGNDVITLSYHVDYWDYIGWKDPFATKEITQKQYAYAQDFSSRNVYTPQVVINGNSHFTGSDSRKMTQALTENKIKHSQDLQLKSVTKSGGKLHANYLLSNEKNINSMTFVLTLKERTTAIKSGENRNRTLTNHNIVIDQVLIKAQNKGSVQLTIPDWITVDDELSLVVYTTKNNVGITHAVSQKVL